MMINLKVVLVNIYSSVMIVKTLNSHFKFRSKERDLESI